MEHRGALFESEPRIKRFLSRVGCAHREENIFSGLSLRASSFGRESNAWNIRYITPHLRGSPVRDKYSCFAATTRNSRVAKIPLVSSISDRAIREKKRRKRERENERERRSGDEIN